MATLEKRIETLEQQHNSNDATEALLRHLGVLNVPPPRRKPCSDDELIAALIRGAEAAMRRLQMVA